MEFIMYNDDDDDDDCSEMDYKIFGDNFKKFIEKTDNNKKLSSDERRKRTTVWKTNFPGTVWIKEEIRNQFEKIIRYLGRDGYFKYIIILKDNSKHKAHQWGSLISPDIDSKIHSHNNLL